MSLLFRNHSRRIIEADLKILLNEFDYVYLAIGVGVSELMTTI